MAKNNDEIWKHAMSGTRKRILLTGGSGLLALNWACAVRDEWDVVLGTHRHQVKLGGTTSVQLELESADQLSRQIDEIAPDLVVHTAGLTNVDRCEDDPTAARIANADIAANVARVAAGRGIKLIHISTDHLFAGTEQMYPEEAPPQPLNEYARSKLLAEKLVQEICPHALVVRTNFFGWGYERRQSFSDWIIYNLRAGKALSLFDDVHFTPILADELVRTAHRLVAVDAAGIFNLVGDERVSKYAFALRLVEQFELPANLIKRDQVSHGHLHARRPPDMSLDNGKARRLLGRDLGGIDQFLAALRQQEQQGRRTELYHCVPA
jgi:dTDP-4-dehydrorhamnose reductase